MSKHPNKAAKRNWLRRGLSGILSLALILALLPGTVLPAQAAHWAMPYAQKLVEWGVMRGDNGNLALDRAITRAEFVAMMNRAYGYTRLGSMPFPDVRTRDWYYEDINIAYNMGYFKGASGYAMPKANLTREMAAVLLARNMMLQPTKGEGLDFSDSRALSEWSRGLVGAAAEMGILGGYSDGSFKPQRNITRGEVASMLVKAIGTPINTKGEHTLGDVYGNVTVNTAGVKLQNGTIAGNLYLTGGIDLGDVLLENVNVLGEIIVSGAGESHSAQSSITLRNVTAEGMTVESITDQFVTIRAEGITSIGTTTVRTNAYVDDSSLPGYGLDLIELDGGKLLQLAGNIKEVINRTPGSDLQVVQGSADKITMDEYATGSKVTVDGDARVDDLNLDVATKVEGEGDIKNLNVGAAGSTVEQLPDDIVIRPGITADINGSTMNKVQADESSADPRLEAGYPKVKNIAPNSADLVFKTNKPGTVYWAVTAVSDGSVSEENLINPPSYGGRILKSGSVKAAAGKTEYNASPALSGLSQAGSYYVSAVFVDNRDQRSPVKVTAFSTPDGTVPAFSDGPRMSRNTTEVAQVTGMPNKSCKLYYALLPAGATAPTGAELKANAVPGNLGYGVRDAVKNTNININVNGRPLDQMTKYVVYLWLEDYDGAKSSRVYSVPFTTPDERAPVIVNRRQSGQSENAIELGVTVDEASTVYWTIIAEGRDNEMAFEGLTDETAEFNPDDRALQMKIESGSGKFVKNGRKQVSANNANKEVTIGLNETRPLDSAKTGTSSYIIYMVAKDAAGNYSKVEKFAVNTKDDTPPRLERVEFTPAPSASDGKPRADATISLVFSENVRGGAGTDKKFLELYEAVKKAVKENPKDTNGFGAKEAMEAEAAARNKLAEALYAHIKLYRGPVAGDTETEVPFCKTCAAVEDTATPGNYRIENSYTGAKPWLINYCYAQVKMEDGKLLVTFPTVKDKDGNVDDPVTGTSALQLESGATYHFVLSGIKDNSIEANDLVPETATPLPFTTMIAKVALNEPSKSPGFMLAAKEKDTPAAAPGADPTPGRTIFTAVKADGQEYGDVTVEGWVASSPDDNVKMIATNKDLNPPQRIDAKFRLTPMSMGNLSDETRWDMLIWANNDMKFTLYSRAVNAADTVAWEREGSAEILGSGNEAGGYGFVSLTRMIRKTSQFESLSSLTAREYIIHVDQITQRGQDTVDFKGWSAQYNVRVSIVAGEDNPLDDLSKTVFNCQEAYKTATQGGGVTSIGEPELFLPEIKFTDTKPPQIISTALVEEREGRGPFIDVTMNNRGRVNYMVIPLNNLSYTENGATIDVPGPNKIKLTDEILKKVSTSYATQNSEIVRVEGNGNQPAITDLDKIGGTDGAGNPNTGVKLSQPTWRKVTSPGSNSETQTGIRIKATDIVPAYSGAPIDLTGYARANTAYFICMVPQGEAGQAMEDYAVGFYFATQEAKKPNLQLDIVDNTDVRATVDRTSEVSQRLLINSSKDPEMTGVFKATFSTLATNASTNGIGSPWSAAAAGLTTRYGGYTVIQAMREDYGNGSVFDFIASDALKARVAQDIRSGFGDGTAILNTGPEKPITINAVGNPATGSQQFGYKTDAMQNTEQYICVAVAASKEGSADAFRAAYYVANQDKDYPKINSVSAGFSTGPNATAANPTITGSISINFHKVLYYRLGANAIYRVAHITSGTGITGWTDNTPAPGQGKFDDKTWQKVNYIGLKPQGSQITVSHVTPVRETSSLMFDIGEVPKPLVGKTSSWEIALPADLCNWWGATMPSSGITIKVTYNWETGEYTKRQIPQNMRGPDYVPSEYSPS